MAGYGKHRDIWTRAHGPIPPRHEIHHRDRNPRNNDLANLQLVTIEEHHDIHNADPTIREIACARCGTTYRSRAARRFCSAACKSAARRASGVDDVERECVICGSAFMVNRYAPNVTCSRSCAARLRWARARGTL